MLTIGLNAYHGDAAACLLKDGVLVAAAEEERFRRVKHWAEFPMEAIRYCLRLLIVLAPPAMLLYVLIVRGGIFDGGAGLYYAAQRTVAEAILSLYLLQKLLRIPA